MCLRYRITNREQLLSISTICPRFCPVRLRNEKLWGQRAAQAPRRKEICLDLNTWNNRRSGEKRRNVVHVVAPVTAKTRRTVQIISRLPRLHPQFIKMQRRRQRRNFLSYNSVWIDYRATDGFNIQHYNHVRVLNQRVQVTLTYKAPQIPTRPESRRK